MSDTPNLKLPYLAAAQSQKHVTHNEALRALDAVVQLGVLDRDLATPPVGPADGDRYIVAAAATGAWSGQSTRVAAWQDGAWAFHAPVEGWLAWLGDENKLVVFDGTAWTDVPGGGGGGSTNLSIANRGATTLDVASDTGGDATVPAATTALAGLLTGADKTKLDGIAAGADVTPTALQSRSMVGINATADTTNRLAVSAPATLLNHEGAGHQVKVNKAAAGDTASFLFQTAFSGRAEMGTTGDDDFHFKVSADGTTWREALTINRTTGAVSFPQELEIDKADLLGLTEATSIDNAADFLLLQTAGGLRRKVKPVNLGLGGGGGGEANTASNVGTAGVGVFKVKSGVDLQFRKINAGSGRITVTLDGGNDEIDIDLGAVAIADVTGLQTALDGKSATGHSHSNATTGAAGFMSSTDKTKLDGVESGATADQSNAEIETAYNAQVAAASQAEAEAGTEAGIRRWSPLRVKQAIDALGGGGGVAFAHHPGNGRLAGAFSAGNGAALTLTDTRKYFSRAYLKAGTYTRLGTRVSTGTASTFVRIAVYNETNGLPSTLISGADSGSIDCSASGDKTVTGLSFTIPSDGWYWIATHASGATVVRGSGTVNLSVLGIDTGSNSVNAWALYRDTAYGAPTADEAGQSYTVVYVGTAMPQSGVGL